eukprot:scaffold316113_cov27-Attheya_sp.AAC.1
MDSILEDNSDEDDDEHMNTSTNEKDESSTAGQLHVGTGNVTDAPCRQKLEDNMKQNVPTSFIEPPMNHDATKTSLFRDANLHTASTSYPCHAFWCFTYFVPISTNNKRKQTTCFTFDNHSHFQSQNKSHRESHS